MLKIIEILQQKYPNQKLFSIQVCEMENQSFLVNFVMQDKFGFSDFDYSIYDQSNDVLVPITSLHDMSLQDSYCTRIVELSKDNLYFSCSYYHGNNAEESLYAADLTTQKSAKLYDCTSYDAYKNSPAAECK